MGAHTNSQASPSEVDAALSAIRRFIRVLRVADAATERAIGLSSAQLFVLQLLAESDGKSVNELAEQTMTDQSSVSTVVTRLANKGLVSRTPSPADARRAIISITQSGLTVLTYAPVSLQQRLIAALKSIPSTSLSTLTRDLSQIISLMGAPYEPPTFLFEDDATGSPN